MLLGWLMWLVVLLCDVLGEVFEWENGMGLGVVMVD